MDGDWRFFDEDPTAGIRRWVLDMGNGQTVMRTEYLETDNLLDANAEVLNASTGQRWGEGKLVARIPMHIWAREILPARQQRDEKYIKKWLNDFDHSKFRTFSGKV